MVEVPYHRFSRSHLRGLWALGDQLYKAKDILCLPHCIVGWVVSKPDASLGSSLGKLGRGGDVKCIDAAAAALKQVSWGRAAGGSGGSPPGLTNAIWGKATVMQPLDPSHAAVVSVYLQKIRLSDTARCLSLC